MGSAYGEGRLFPIQQTILGELRSTLTMLYNSMALHLTPALRDEASERCWLVDSKIVVASKRKYLQCGAGALLVLTLLAANANKGPLVFGFAFSPLRPARYHAYIILARRPGPRSPSMLGTAVTLFRLCTRSLPLVVGMQFFVSRAKMSSFCAILVHAMFAFWNQQQGPLLASTPEVSTNRIGFACRSIHVANAFIITYVALSKSAKPKAHLQW